MGGVEQMNPVVEGHPYPVSIESPLIGVKYITLRIGNYKRGQTQKTHLSLSETEVLAYALLREVAERKVEIERLNEELQRHNEEVQSARESAVA
jgi:hypothetical protein